MTISSFLIKDTPISGTAYAIAIVLVLLPISFITDIFYSKQEPQHKRGGIQVVMIIHAVIFALFGIGSLIAAVIAVVMMFVSSGDHTGAKITLFSSLIIALYYAITFLRTLNPARLPLIKRSYKFVMLVTVGIIALLGILGPVAKERGTRDDRLISSHLPSVASAVSSYSRTNKKLPESLEDLSLSGDAEKLAKSGKVTYKQQGTGTSTNTSTRATTTRTVFKYDLCVKYKAESNGYGRYGDIYTRTNTEYTTSYVSTYAHPAGDVCYKLITSEY
jgi:hypothetical protein